MARLAPVIGAELSDLMAEFDRIENDIISLSSIIGAAYGLDWCGRGLRLAQLLRALKVRVEDHGYDRLSCQDRAAFQSAQHNGQPVPQTLSALEIVIKARRAEQRKARATLNAVRTRIQP